MIPLKNVLTVNPIKIKNYSPKFSLNTLGLYLKIKIFLNLLKYFSKTRAHVDTKLVSHQDKQFSIFKLSFYSKFCGKLNYLFLLISSSKEIWNFYQILFSCKHVFLERLYNLLTGIFRYSSRLH